MSGLALVQHAGGWYVLEQVAGRARLYQLEVGPVRVHWKGLADGETPVVEMGSALPLSPASRRRLTLWEHFWFAALVTAVIMVLPVALSVRGC